jgi:hypothetical protein
MKKYLFIAVVSILISGCSSYSVPKESFLTQLQDLQELKREHNVNSVGTGYDSNGIKKFKCIDKSGKEVWLYGGKNVNFKITNSAGESVTMYFDTVFLQNDTVFGLKSRIVGGKRKIPVSEIVAVGINAEEAITEPVK